MSASPISDKDLFEWEATVFGPEETPWEGGIFNLRLNFDEEYPNTPPKVLQYGLPMLVTVGEIRH